MSVNASLINTFSYHGPITRTVADAALMMNVLSGPDDEDPLSLPADGVDYVEAIKPNIKGWRIAYSPDLGLGYVDPEVAQVVADAVRAFEEMGAIVTEAAPNWPHPEEAMWKGVWLPGFAGLYDQLDWNEFHGEVDDNLIEIMAQVASTTTAETGRADIVRSQVYTAFTEFMSDFDLLVSPTLASASIPLTDFTPAWLKDAPLPKQILGWLLTYPFNMISTPAISVPAGFTADGRPVGLQIASRRLRDIDALRAAANFEQARPWANLFPPIA